MIASAYDDHDVTRHWMSHHLAALVVAAEGQEGSVTVEQRIEIVNMILRIWGSRRSSPGHAPGYELDQVFAALDFLGDDTPWRFSRLQNLARSLRVAEEAEVPLILKAAHLERLTREALVILIGRACQEAITRNEAWLAAAKAVSAETEDELVSSTQRVSRTLMGRVGDEPWSADADVAENMVATKDVALKLRAMAHDLLVLADELGGEAAAD